MHFNPGLNSNCSQSLVNKFKTTRIFYRRMDFIEEQNLFTGATVSSDQSRNLKAMNHNDLLLLQRATEYHSSCTDIFMIFTEQGMSTYFAFLAGEGEEFLMFFYTL